jgi:hypothetical protein
MGFAGMPLEECLPCNEEQRCSLPPPVVASPCAHVGILRGFKRKVVRRGLVLPCRMRDGVARGLSLEARVCRICAKGRRRGAWQKLRIERIEQIRVGDFENDVHGGWRWTPWVLEIQVPEGCDSRSLGRKVRGCCLGRTTMRTLTIVAAFASRRGIEEEEDNVKNGGDRYGRLRSVFEDSPLLSAMVPDKDLH